MGLSCENLHHRAKLLGGRLHHVLSGMDVQSIWRTYYVKRGRADGPFKDLLETTAEHLFTGDRVMMKGRSCTSLLRQSDEGLLHPRWWGDAAEKRGLDRHLLGMPTPTSTRAMYIRASRAKSSRRRCKERSKSRFQIKRYVRALLRGINTQKN